MDAADVFAAVLSFYDGKKAIVMSRIWIFWGDPTGLQQKPRVILFMAENNPAILKVHRHRNLLLGESSTVNYGVEFESH